MDGGSLEGKHIPNEQHRRHSWSSTNPFPVLLIALHYNGEASRSWSGPGPHNFANSNFPFLHNFEILVKSWQKFMDSPHVYAVADAAYNEMIRDEVNQSIIIRNFCTMARVDLGRQRQQKLLCNS